MQKKEILEIKKQFKFDDALTRVAGCYVDAEKRIISVFTKSFGMIGDSDRMKYMEIFKKALSGSKGKQLNDAEFPQHAEGDGSMHAMLMKIRADELKDAGHLQEFFEAVVEAYPHEGNYCILAAHDNYDVPGKGTDELLMDDASDTVYSFVIMAFCPVELAKPGLSYHSEEGIFLSVERDWVVGAPEYGLTFPAFDDRAANIHAMLVYDKKEDRQSFTTDFFKATMGAAASKQCEVFTAMVQDAFDDEPTVKDVVNVISEITEITEAYPDLESINCEHVLDILESSGASKDNIKKSGETFKEELGSAQVEIDNIISTKTLSIEGDGIKIIADISYANRITEEENEHGARFLKIPISDCVVNGIAVGKK